MWEHLPYMILEEIFSKLSTKDRYACARVCGSWYNAFLSPRLWKELIFRENRFTYLRHHMTRGYEREISHHKIQMCLSVIGNYIQHLTIQQLPDYHHLYEIMNVVSTYLEFFKEYPMPLLNSFSFTFACESRGLTGTIILGTGGKLLDELKRLLRNLKGLTSFTLNQLLLDNRDAIGILDGVIKNCSGTLKYLEILNCTKERYPLFYCGMFTSLEKLVITPTQLTSDVVFMLTKHASFKELVIVQDPYTSEIESLSRETWLTVKQDRPDMKVTLEIRGVTDKTILIQERAPVHKVLYHSPHSLVNVLTILQIVDHYHRAIRVYGHTCLPRKHGSRSFHDRADTSLVLLIRECPFIQTLYIKDRVSTATLLIIASEAKNLQHLHVRRNAVLKKFDWPRASHWADDFYQWLKATSRSYEHVEAEISKILQVPWKMLSDKEYLKLKK